MKKAKFEIYKDRVGEWRWRLKAKNGENIAPSSQGHPSKRLAIKGVESVIESAKNADIVYV